ncbi:MAG: L-histidine N(alpha)-methyltransferase [Myxococcota bacterium]
MRESDQPRAEGDRYAIRRVPNSIRSQDVSQIVREGLSQSPKELRPILFYDARGSELFEQICRLPSYYVTRTEELILKTHGQAILDSPRRPQLLYELGSGSSLKTEHLVRIAWERDASVRYLATDISESALVGAAERLTERMPGLRMDLLVASYEAAVDIVHQKTQQPRFGMFVGGNIGNFPRGDARAFLASISAQAHAEDRLMIGLDLVKDTEVLVRAYDDPEGVTAEFNINALRHINRVLGANFDLDAFRHVALWNEDLERIEMHLESRRRQAVHIRDLDMQLSFEDGERIHTENSHKYRLEGLEDFARSAGWTLEERWTDPDVLFCVLRLAPSTELVP